MLARALCLVLAAQAAAVTLVPRVGGLHLRGGADGEDGDDAAKLPDPVALSRETIVQKLNDVPTFTLIGEEQGGFVALNVADDDTSSICFFVDAEEAKQVLKMMDEAHPGKGLRLACVGLGTAFKICGGWPDDTEAAKAFGSFDGKLKLRGSLPIVEGTNTQLREMMKGEGLEVGEWVLPIFICEELQARNLVPMFLNPADARETWTKAGRKEEDFPEKLVMMDVRMLVNKMSEATAPWDRFQFIGSSGAATFANELINGAAKEMKGAAAEAAAPAPAVADGLDDAAMEDEDVLV